AASPLGNLAGKTNAQVAQLYKNLSGVNSGNASNNTFIQAAAAAFGIYADTTGLGGASLVSNGLAAKYNFLGTAAGGGAATVSDAANAPAFGTISNTALTIGKVLSIIDANYNPQTQQLFGGDSIGVGMANNVLTGVNLTGNITLLTQGSALKAA